MNSKTKALGIAALVASSIIIGCGKGNKENYPHKVADNPQKSLTYYLVNGAITAMKNNLTPTPEPKPTPVSIYDRYCTELARAFLTHKTSGNSSETN